MKDTIVTEQLYGNQLKKKVKPSLCVRSPVQQDIH